MGSSERDLAVQSMWLGTLKNDKIIDARRKYTTISNLKEPNKSIGYLSSTRYVREHLLGEKQQKSTDNDGRKSRATAHRDIEELEDEITAVKKSLNAHVVENTQLQAKIRRLLDENKQKDLELQELVDQQSEAQKALQTETADGKSVSKSVVDIRKAQTTALINNLKVKIAELQAELESTKANLKKMQNDVKSTNIKDLRVQSEVFYAELQRLRNLLPSEQVFDQMEKTKPTQPKRSADIDERISALQTTIDALSREKADLRTERASMKKQIEKLQRELDREQSRVARLKAIEDDEGGRSQRDSKEKTSKSNENRRYKTDFDKYLNLTRDEDREHIALRGSAEDRLAQLEKREGHLLTELRKRDKLLAELVKIGKQLEDDAESSKRRVRDLEVTVERLENENSHLRKQINKRKVMSELKRPGKADEVTSSLSESDSEQRHSKYSSSEDLARNLQASLRGNYARKKAIENSPVKRRRSRDRGSDESGSGSEDGSDKESPSRSRSRSRSGSASGSDSRSRSGSRSRSNSAASNRSKSPTSSDRKSMIDPDDAIDEKKGKSSFFGICGSCTGVVSPSKK